jgi:hypothetical protein
MIDNKPKISPDQACWLMPVIPAPKEKEIQKITVQSQSR